MQSWCIHFVRNHAEIKGTPLTHISSIVLYQELMSRRRSMKHCLPGAITIQIVCRLVSLYKETKISLFEAVYEIVRNEIATHGNSEAYSSPKLLRHPLTFQMIRNFPV